MEFKNILSQSSKTNPKLCNSQQITKPRELSSSFCLFFILTSNFLLEVTLFFTSKTYSSKWAQIWKDQVILFKYISIYMLYTQTTQACICVCKITEFKNVQGQNQEVLDIFHSFLLYCLPSFLHFYRDLYLKTLWAVGLAIYSGQIWYDFTVE